MKALITGGYGFIGSHTAERFYREGYEIYIIDNLSTGDKENLKIKHKFYQMNVEDKECREIFSNNKFDVVIHLAAHIDAVASVEKPYFDAESNVLGLINMLYLSSKYEVKKFVFASSAAVYGNNDKIPISEEEECCPISPYGVSKLTGEQYCRLWRKIYGLDAIALRFSNVYGPRQSIKGEGGVVTNFMNNVFNSKELIIYGTGEQTRDFIYVADVVDAIFKAVEFCHSEVLNISLNKKKSIMDLISSIKRLHPFVKVKYTNPRKGDILHSRLSNDAATTELNWTPLYDLDRGIERTYQWYKRYNEEKQVINDKENKSKEKKKKTSLVKKILPYIENILVFLMVFFLSRYSRNNGMDIAIDFKLVYIIVISIIYGLRQSSIAVFLSCALLIWELGEMGRDIISLIYNVNTLIYFSLYIFIGVVLGYSIDNKNYVIDTKDDEMTGLKEKFDFLYEMYNESKLVRKELQDQIISTEDSFGKIYKITSSLNTLEPEKVYAQTVSIIEEILKAKDVYIFSVTKEQNYLRLISKSKESNIEVPKSIKVSDISEIENQIKTKAIFVNKELKKSLPMMMSPIVVNDRVLAIIAIYKMDFETVSLYKQNLFKVVSDLITSSLVRAYQYDQVINDEKYISGTIVLKHKYFTQLLQSKIEAKERNNTDFIMFKVCKEDWRNSHIPYKIEKSIRELDYIGVNEKNELLVLLSNTKMEEAQYVIKRFKSINIQVEIIEEGEDYDSIYFSTSIA